ncbi:hypothetical protein [Flavicella marina]|uniref:hypothetical protein n=1 Tax=Flavicella marina TaxID=1475951 RepID=UPI00186AD071|nr:hypothetical protein [Flavicella marina]
MDIRLIPNGIKDISIDGEKSSALRFSLAIMLVNIDTYESIPIDLDLLQKTGEFIHDVINDQDASLVKLFINEEEVPYFVNNDSFNPYMTLSDGAQVEDEQNGWVPFFSSPEKQIKLLPYKALQDVIEAQETELQFVDQNIEKNYTLSEAKERIHPYEKRDQDLILKDLLEVESHLNKINKQSSEHRNLFEKSGKLELINILHTPENKPQFLIDYEDSNVVDLNDIMAKILKHPNMAKNRYGVVVEILIPVEKLPSTAINSEVLNACIAFKTRETKLENIIFSENGIFDTFVSETFSYSKINEVEGDYHIITKSIDEISKWYHGKTNYGLITNETLSEKIEWKNRSRLNSLNSKYSSIKNATSKEGYFERISQKNPNYTRGIIARHKLTPKEFEQVFQPEGVIGHNILVQKSKTLDDQNPKMASLNIHKAVFKGPNVQSEFLEEGYLSLDAVNSLLDEEKEKEFASMDLWDWKGKNLSVPNVGEVLDMSNEESSEPEEEYVYDEDFDVFFKKYGFTHEMNEVKASNISLTKNHYYSYVIRNVLPCNGYLFPTHSEEETEYTFQDLSEEEKQLYFLNYQQTKYPLPEGAQDFEKPQAFQLILKKNPISPPNIVALKKFEEIQNVDTQNENIQDETSILAVEKGNNKEQLDSIRYLYPAQSTLQFHTLSGKLERGNKDDSDFKNLVVDKILKSFSKIPVVYDKLGSVDYLSDPRLMAILIAPNDWKTRANISNGVIVYKIPANELQNNAYKIESITSPDNTFNINLQDGVLKIHLPKSFEGEFRIHSLTKYPIDFLTGKKTDYFKDLGSLIKLRYENPYSRVHIIHTDKKPLEPVLIDPNNEIKARRFKLDDDSKYGKFIFADFKVNRDIGRKELSMVTESDQIIDIGNNDPDYSLDTVEEKTFLNNEYDANVFKQTIGNLSDHIEDDIYPNTFGLQMNLPFAGLDLLNKGDEVCNFKINHSFSIKVLLGEKKKHKKTVVIAPDIPVVRDVDPRIDPWIDPFVIGNHNVDIDRFKESDKEKNTFDNLEIAGDINRSISVYDFSVVLVNTSTRVERELFSKKHTLTNADLPSGSQPVDNDIFRDLLCNYNGNRDCSSIRNSFLLSDSHKQQDLQNCSFIIDYKYHYDGPILNLYYSEFFDHNGKENNQETLFKKYSLEGEENLFEIIGLPDKSISNENCTLHKDVEEFLLYNDKDYLFGVRQFENEPHLSVDLSKFTINHSHQSYFICRDEGDTKYKKKKFRLRVTNKFDYKFPNLPYNSLVQYSDPAKKYFLTIPNAKKPESPSISLTPIFHQLEEKDSNTSTYSGKQFYRLMIEVDRPWSEDELALIIKRTPESEKSSDIGIDITNKSLDTFEDHYITQYLITEPESNTYFGEQQYLKKYILDHEEVTVDNEVFEIQRLKLSFFAPKNKWIAVIGFENFNSVQDPFLKLVFARYQRNSERIDRTNETLSLSKPAAPLFIRSLSDRFVSIENSDIGHHIKIRVSNRKNHNASSHNLFIARVLENTLASDESNIQHPSQLSGQWSILKDIASSEPNENLIPYQEKDQSVLICEIQKFDNFDSDKLIQDIKEGNIDIFNTPEVKIIFMKEILFSEFLIN